LSIAVRQPADALRVGMVVNNLNVGGLEKVAVNLIRLLQRGGHDPHLICLDGAGTMFGEVDLPPEKTLVLDKRVKTIAGLSFDFSLLPKIRRFAIERRLQVLHTHNLAPLVYAGVAARLTWQRPLVVYSEHNQIYSASPAVRRRFSYYIRLADQVIAVSHDLRRELVDVVRTRQPVTVVHNGIDALAIEPDARAAARALFGAGQEFVFGMVAVLSRQKGISYLLKAARRVVSERPATRFVVVGDGPLRDELIDERNALGLEDHVLFTGYRSDIPRMMAGFDTYVQSSLWEGLPIVLLEALAAGKPIVTTGVGGNAEVVEHEVNGLVVPPGSVDALAAALLRIADDHGLRTAAEQRNREKFSRQFASEAMLAGHLGVYARAR
jgi:glycosyltransferase involved in cell wall biosynthesis